MKKLMEVVHAEPEVRSDLILKYKGLIKSGEYKVGAEELTSSILIESMQEFKP